MIYGKDASVFNDVVIGANGAPATPGWDYTAGRGIPDIAAFAGG